MGKTSRRVGLEGIKFNAAIGYFEEERIYKNNFLVDVSVLFTQNDVTQTEDLSQTVDYGLLYEICKQEFAKESLLIETVAQQILDKILSDFSFIEEAQIKIRKLNPPIKAQIQQSFIELNYQK